MNTYSVYILASKRNGTLYVGVTNNLMRRMYEHREGLVDGFTKKYTVKMLVWYENFSDINEALSTEKRIKNWKREYKINTIEENNPDWKDLYGELVL